MHSAQPKEPGLVTVFSELLVRSLTAEPEPCPRPARAGTAAPGSAGLEWLSVNTSDLGGRRRTEQLT